MRISSFGGFDRLRQLLFVEFFPDNAVSTIGRDIDDEVARHCQRLTGGNLWEFNFQFPFLLFFVVAGGNEEENQQQKNDVDHGSEIRAIGVGFSFANRMGGDGDSIFIGLGSTA